MAADMTWERIMIPVETRVTTLTKIPLVMLTNNQEVSLSPVWTYPFTNSSDESDDTNFDLVGNFYAKTEDEEDDDDEDDDEEEDEDDDNDSQSSRRYLQMSTWS